MPALLGCAALLGLFATLAWFAVATKSPTFDEPLHAVAAWHRLHQGDFRVDPEDPPLWMYWAALPNGSHALGYEEDDPLLDAVAEQTYREWGYVAAQLYARPGVNAEALIMRSRAMMLAVGAALGVLVAGWAWRIGGAVAAMGAVVLFTLDPTLLGHAPLVKNDVAFALAMAATAGAAWAVGRKLTLLNAAALAIAFGSGFVIKFSALLMLPILGLMLGARALLPWTWTVLGRALERRWQRAAAAAAMFTISIATAWLLIWASYGFRYAPTPKGDVLLNTNYLVKLTATANLFFGTGELRRPTTAEINAWRPGAFVKCILFAERHHLLPQAWTNGLAYTYQSALVRKAYLLGEHSFLGWWYYFPFAMAVKWPLAILAALGLAGGFGAWRLMSAARHRTAHEPARYDALWTTICLATPVVVYLAVAMRSNLNLGVRHVVPIYPMLFIATGVALAAAWRRRRVAAMVVAGALGVALGAETLAAFPDYIAFFNRAAGGSAGGIRLLGDSNLDWGQDLKLLSLWQQDHPNRPLYLAYFGIALPEYYGIQYHNLPHGNSFGPPPELPTGPCVLAISATRLQGLDTEGEAKALYKYVREQLTPFEILGGSIYLYEFRPRPDLLPTSAPASSAAGN